MAGAAASSSVLLLRLTQVYPNFTHSGRRDGEICTGIYGHAEKCQKGHRKKQNREIKLKGVIYFYNSTMNFNFGTGLKTALGND